MKFWQKIQKRIAVLSCVAMIAGTGIAAAQVVTVDGYGDDRESAMKDAKRMAASQLAGTYIKAETVMENTYVISDEIFARTAGYISVKEIIIEEQKNGVYHIKAKLDGGNDFANALNSARNVVDTLNNPRISVFVNENGSYNQISMDGLSCEGIMANYLVEKGMTNVVAGNKNADCEYKAMISLVLTTNPVKLQNYKDLSRGNGAESTRHETGLVRTTAAMELRVIDTDTNELVGQFTLYSTAMDSDEANARRKATNDVTVQASEKMWQIFNRRATVVGDDKVLKVRVDDYAKLDSLLKALKSITGVESATSRDYKNGKATIGVNTSLSSNSLYRRIAEKYKGTVRVDNLTDDTLEISIN